ncbi:MAG: ISAzo13 family transposase [Bryobacterales bacterium]|nr:ISAzo13 family transposase [Bryobacterales bacterium]
MEFQERLKQKFTTLFGYLDERQRRIAAAVEARSLGRGGITAVARATGMSRPSIHKGLGELRQRKPGVPLGHSRKSGAGRKPLAVRDPQILGELDRLVDPDTRGDPMSPLRWTCKSTRQLADALRDGGHPISHRLVGELLASMGYSLQANIKTKEGSSHPDRDAQFRYLNEQVRNRLERQRPVISVDSKKKELIDYKNGGSEWQPKGDPEPVQVHDFGKEKGIPHGIYDVGRNLGWVTVGRDHDTASFAVASIRRWWMAMGSTMYPGAAQLLICADGGGSNGYRLRLWKVELQRFADETGLTVTVCHLPPGTSKWNKIEHRLFSHISMNWRGRPLTSHEVVVELIAATTTRKGLRVRAELDPASYPTGVEVTDAQIEALSLRRHTFHGEWNYDLCPRPTKS